MAACDGAQEAVGAEIVDEDGLVVCGGREERLVWMRC